MNSNTNDQMPGKVEAKVGQAMGSAKETMGDMTGNTEMKSEGQAQNVKGHGKDIGAMFTKLSHEVEGTFKGVFNALSGKSSSGSSSSGSNAATGDNVESKK